MDIASGIVSTANRLGMKPIDLATIVSFETGGTFNPTKEGPTTKWGTHRGFIQFGEPQAKEYGVDWSNPVESQLKPGGAIEKYFLANGWKSGMSLKNAYAIVNAGSPYATKASDAKAGGTWGTVEDKVNYQMAGHKKNALELLKDKVGESFSRGKNNVIENSALGRIFNNMGWIKKDDLTETPDIDESTVPPENWLDKYWISGVLIVGSIALIIAGGYLKGGNVIKGIK